MIYRIKYIRKWTLKEPAKRYLILLSRSRYSINTWNDESTKTKGRQKIEENKITVSKVIFPCPACSLVHTTIKLTEQDLSLDTIKKTPNNI